MPLEIKSKVQNDFNITGFNIKEEEEPSIYDLQYLVYRLDIQRGYCLNDLETKIISFILSYANISEKFYFSNESMGRIFGKSERSISRCVSSLEDKGLISVKTTIRANGGTIRFVQLDKNGTCEWTKTSTQNRQECLQSNNNINNNKKDISKDIGKSQTSLELGIDIPVKKEKEKPSYYGSTDINACVSYLEEKLGASLDGSVKENRRYCYNLLRKMKKDFPGVNEVDQVKMLIDTALQDRFHSKNTTSFKYLFYNTQRIAQSFKNDYGIGSNNSDMIII
jgi:hypothetical protein